LSLDFRRAQSYSISSKVYNKKIDGTICIPSSEFTCVPCGWGIHFNGIGSTSYTIFADLASAVNCSDRDFIRASSGFEDFETISLESGITVNTTSSTLTDVIFTPPEPTVKFTPDQAEANITIINKKLATSTITINKNGFISSP